MITRDPLSIATAALIIGAVCALSFAGYKARQEANADWARFMQSVERRKMCAYVPRTALDSAAYDKCMGEETAADKCKESGGDYMIIVSKMPSAKCVRWVEYKEVE